MRLTGRREHNLLLWGTRRPEYKLTVLLDELGVAALHVGHPVRRHDKLRLLRVRLTGKLGSTRHNRFIVSTFHPGHASVHGLARNGLARHGCLETGRHRVGEHKGLLRRWTGRSGHLKLAVT